MIEHGARVRFIGKEFEHIGMAEPHPRGTVHGNQRSSGSFTVVFDEPHHRFHDGDLGHQYADRCWFCRPGDLKIIEPDEVVARKTVKITL